MFGGCLLLLGLLLRVFRLLRQWSEGTRVRIDLLIDCVDDGRIWVVVSQARRVLVEQPWPLYLVYTHPGARHVHHRLFGENQSIDYSPVFSVDLNVEIACLVS
jgi:hypothetical protein